VADDEGTQTQENDVMNEAERNAEAVRRGYAAFNSADMKTLTELFDESATWHTPGRSSIAGDHKGRDAVFAQFGRYGGETKGTFKATLLQVLKSDDGRVIGIHHNTAERAGKRLDVGCCIVFEFKDGRVIDGREHFYDLYAWDEFWR
jgi:ketosteroid isomerase-like protein